MPYAFRLFLFADEVLLTIRHYEAMPCGGASFEIDHMLIVYKREVTLKFFGKVDSEHTDEPEINFLRFLLTKIILNLTQLFLQSGEIIDPLCQSRKASFPGGIIFGVSRQYLVQLRIIHCQDCGNCCFCYGGICHHKDVEEKRGIYLVVTITQPMVVVFSGF